MKYPKKVNKPKVIEPSLNELHAYMKKMRNKGYSPYLKGKEGSVKVQFE